MAARKRPVAKKKAPKSRPAGSYLTNRKTKKNQLDSAFNHLKKRKK